MNISGIGHQCFTMISALFPAFFGKNLPETNAPKELPPPPPPQKKGGNMHNGPSCIRVSVSVCVCVLGGGGGWGGGQRVSQIHLLTSAQLTLMQLICTPYKLHWFPMLNFVGHIMMIFQKQYCWLHFNGHCPFIDRRVLRNHDFFVHYLHLSFC